MSGPLTLIEGDEADPSDTMPSFDLVYRQEAMHVYRFCLSQLGDPETAADVSQDTFAKAFPAYKRVSPDPNTTRTWLLTIARNCCIDHRRRTGRWQRLLGRLGQLRERPIDVEALADERLELQRVQAAILQLRVRERELIGLRVAADLSFREVASVLGMSEQATKVATRRALIRLRSRLADPPRSTTTNRTPNGGQANG